MFVKAIGVDRFRVCTGIWILVVIWFFCLFFLN